jgi:hypothetical protein
LLSTTLTILLLIPVGILVSCRDSQYIDPSPASSSDLHLRYDYPQESLFSYRQTIDRKEYGANTGEERMLQLHCRSKSAEVASFIAIDSLLFTSSGNNRYMAGLREAEYFEMQHSGAPAGARAAAIAAPKPIVPLPALPVEVIPSDRKVTEDIPYSHKLTANARVVSSQRERVVHRDESSTETTFEEKVVQVVETNHGTDSMTTGSTTYADREMMTYDSLVYTRSITLSAPIGYLIRSRETKREVVFIPATVTGSESTGSILHGRYTINESESLMELIEVLAAKH